MANYAAKLLDMPVAKVGEDEVLDVLRPIWKTIPMTADRVRFRINAVIEHATIKRLYVGPNPARTKALIDVLLGKAEVAAVVNQPSLPYAELPAVVALLRAKKGIAAKATLFTTLTAVRTDEARLALKSEVNFDTKLWLVPAARVKGKKGEANSPERIVPLSDAAIEVLRTLQDSDSIYLFPGTKEGQTLNPSSLNDMLVKPKAKGCLDLKGKATMHGMRASFSTWANEQLTFDKDAIELCLAHVVGTKVSRAYNRSEKLAERTRIMQAWGNYCFGISNLVQLERAA
jgi:integrase